LLCPVWLQAKEGSTKSIHDFKFEEYNLNQEQISALKSIIHGVNSKERHYDVILGPSGSGKTTVVGYMLLQLHKDSKSIVVVPTT
jgi:DNA replication protein DnaC